MNPFKRIFQRWLYEAKEGQNERICVLEDKILALEEYLDIHLNPIKKSESLADVFNKRYYPEYVKNKRKAK